MNYRHAFHAGSFADVFKHICLILVIESLLAKEKPFCYLDTHAGIGKYDLKSKEALKTKEFEVGIGELFSESGKKPAVVERYIQIVKEMNPNQKLQFYPGSPRIARSLVRPEDQMILTELHPVDAKSLKDEFKFDKQVSVHLLDGYLALKAFLPPTPRRGLVLIDPPYEAPHEFATLSKSLTIALKRWREGIYMIWYPVKNRFQIEIFEKQLKKKDIKELLICEFNLYPDDSPLALNGSGVAILNPPWKLEQKIREVLPWLLRTLDKQGQGKFRIEKSTM